MKFGLRKYWKIFLGAFVLIVLALIYFGFRYRGHVSSAFGWISEETGGKTMAVLAIVLTLIGLVYAFFCLIFPIIVFFKLHNLHRRIIEVAQIVETLGRQKAVEKPRENQDIRGQ